MPNSEEIRKKTEALEAEEKSRNGHNARRRVAAKRARDQEEDPRRKLDQAGNAFVKKRHLRKEMVFEVFQTCRDALDEEEPLEVEKLPEKLTTLESEAIRTRRHRQVIDYLMGKDLPEDVLDEILEQDDQFRPVHQPLLDAMDEAVDDEPTPDLLEALDELAAALEEEALPRWYPVLPGGVILEDIYKPGDPDELDVKVDAIRSLIELYEEADKLDISLPRSKKVLGARVRRYLTPTRKDSKNFG